MRTRFGNLSLTIGPRASGDIEHDREHETADARLFNTQEQSALFKLPTEIRLYIYELLLVIPCDSHGIRITNTPARPHEPTVLSVLATCKLVNSEAETIFYSLNRLSIEQSDFLSTLGHRRLNAIRRVSIPGSKAASVLNSLNGLERAANLESLYFVRKQSIRFTNVSEWRMMAPQLMAAVERIEGLQEVRVITPKVENATAHEEAQIRRLDQVDQRLCRTAKGSRVGLQG